MRERNSNAVSVLLLCSIILKSKWCHSSITLVFYTFKAHSKRSGLFPPHFVVVYFLPLYNCVFFFQLSSSLFFILYIFIYFFYFLQAVHSKGKVRVSTNQMKTVECNPTQPNTYSRQRGSHVRSVKMNTQKHHIQNYHFTQGCFNEMYYLLPLNHPL